MNSKELLKESKSTNVVVCDVQPEYDKFCHKIVEPLCNFLNNQTGKIYVWFNGQGLTSDDMPSVKWYYVENGLDEEKLENITFIEKEYGFLRNWMDLGASNKIIIKVIRAMHQQKIDDSRDLDMDTVLSKDELEELDDSFDSQLWWQENPIQFPYWFEVNELRNMSPFYICGGGEKECLREVELLCNAFNIKYKRIKNLVY